MFKTLIDGCEPTRGSKFSACVDLYASEDMVIGAGETKLVGLGVAIDFDEAKYLAFNMDDYGIYGDLCDSEKVEHFLSSHYLQLMLRSSLSKKLVIGNGVGVIDLDYKDEIKIRLHNPLEISFERSEDSSGYVECANHFKIKKGDRIAQITLIEHKSYLFGIDSEDERTGGFGSTDKKENHV